MNTAQNPRVVSLGSSEADPHTRELRKQGLKLKLQELPLQVLATLLARPGQLVSREEIRSRLWPGDTFIDLDGGLNTAVRRLREALNDDAETLRFLRPKSGAAPRNLLNPMEPTSPRRLARPRTSPFHN